MSRSIQVGDFVNVSQTGIQDIKYLIYKIDGTNIYIHPLDNIKLILLMRYDNNMKRWVIDGADTGYTLNFSEGLTTTFTGIENVDIDILNFLDDLSLSNACMTNTYLNKLCRNEDLWRRRLEKYYPDRIVLKTKDLSWRDFYIALSDAEKWDHKRLFQLDNAIEILEWMKRNDIKLISDMYFDAAMIDKIDIMNWLYENGVDLEDYNDDIIDLVKHSKLLALKWLYDHDVLDDFVRQKETHLMELAIENDDIDMIDWMYEADLDDNIYESYFFENPGYGFYNENYSSEDGAEHMDAHMLSVALDNESEKSIKYFLENGTFGIESVNYAIYLNDLNALKLLKEKKDILPNTIGANIAATDNYKDILEWLAMYNIYPEISTSPSG
jgi:hypothetical protein